MESQMLKGVLNLLLLSLIISRDDYGYSIVQRLQRAGFEDVAEGSVYPALTRLERSGWVEAYQQKSGAGPARKYYRITQSGRDQAESGLKNFVELVTGVEVVTGQVYHRRSPGDEDAS